MELSIVIPAHNEAGNIEPLVKEIHTALNGFFSYEIIYVDDGSTDTTLQELKKIQSQYSLVQEELSGMRIIHQQTTCGQSTALWTGIRVASADWIVTLDGDGQNDPLDIPKLLAEIPSQFSQLQLITGMRIRRHDHWVRRWSSKLANAIRAYLLKDDTPDTGCGLKLIQREAFLALPYFDHMHRFLPALIRRNGGTVKSVAVNHRPRIRGHSHYGIHNRLWVGMADLLGVLWLQRRVRLPIITEIVKETTTHHDAQ